MLLQACYNCCSKFIGAGHSGQLGDMIRSAFSSAGIPSQLVGEIASEFG